MIENKRIIAQFNKDANGNNILIDIEEIVQVNPNNYIAQLSQIPSEDYGVNVLSPINFYEVFNSDDEILANNYKVLNYNDRQVKFHPSVGGLNVKVKYKGIGVEYLSADSIWYILDKEGNVVKTLKGLLDEATLQLELLEASGGAIVVINELKQNIENGKVLNTSLTNSISLASPINDSLKVLIPQATVIESKLEIENIEANRIFNLLEPEVNAGNALKPQLEQTIASATNINNLILGTDNGIKEITTLMWGSIQPDGKYHFNWSHGLVSEAINLAVWEIVDNRKVQALVDTEIINNNTIIFKVDIPKHLHVVSNHRTYGGTVASLGVFTTDDLAEGTNRKYVKIFTHTFMQNQFTSFVEDGVTLRRATLTHNLNRNKFSNCKAYVNGIEILADFEASKVVGRELLDLVVTIEAPANTEIILEYV